MKHKIRRFRKSELFGRKDPAESEVIPIEEIIKQLSFIGNLEIGVYPYCESKDLRSERRCYAEITTARMSTAEALENPSCSVMYRRSSTLEALVALWEHLTEPKDNEVIPAKNLEDGIKFVRWDKRAKKWRKINLEPLHLM